MMNGIDIKQAVQANGGHGHLQTPGHESDSTLERLHAAIWGTSSLGVERGAVPLINEAARVLKGLPNSMHLPGKWIGIEKSAGQQILSRCHHPLGERKLPGLGIGPEKLLGHGRSQGRLPGVREGGQKGRGIQVACMAGCKNNRRA